MRLCRFAGQFVTVRPEAKRLRAGKSTGKGEDREMEKGEERSKAGEAAGENAQEAVRVRAASVSDAEALLEIYAPYVEKTAVSFEYETPGKEEFERRIENTLKKYPYLVAEKEGELLGYVYTGPFVGRAAYGWSAEVSIYLRMDQRRRGIGGQLYRALEEVSRAQNILNLNACIGEPETEDEYLTKDSVQFHTHMGYRRVGGFRRCGYKFGRWYDMVWMEKLLGVHPSVPRPVIPFPELDAELLAGLGIQAPGGKGLCR